MLRAFVIGFGLAVAVGACAVASVYLIGVRMQRSGLSPAEQERQDWEDS